MEKFVNQYRRFRARIHPVAFFVFFLFLFCLIAHFFFYISASFADFFNLTVGAFFRSALAILSGLFPFSIAEALVFLFLPLLIAALVFVYRVREPLKQSRLISLLVAFILLLYCSFVLTFASGYRGSSLSEKMKLEREKIEPVDLYHTSVWLLEEIEQLLPSIDFDGSGASVMPLAFDEMTAELRSSYKRLCGDYDFVSFSPGLAKQVAASGAMSYTRILGVYTFFTGEANINTNFSDFCTVFTAAHEMAHQRGFSREDEANMMAFLACRESDVPYIRYAGYYEMLRYVLSALASSNTMYYAEVWHRMPEPLRREGDVYAQQFEPYRQSAVANVSGAINDTYLKLQGTEGSRSYGLVVDLAVALYKKEVM